MLEQNYVEEMLKIEDKLVNDVSGKELMKHTTEIAKWVRVSGTDEEVESLRYVAGQLEEYGYKTKITFRPGFISVPVRASVEIEAPVRMAFEALTHSFCVSTPVCGLSGKVVGKSCANVAGKIVLSCGLPSVDEVRQLQNEQAIAVIYVQDDRLHNSPVSPLWGGPVEYTEHLLPKIPVVSIRRNDGALLEGFMKDGRARVRIEASHRALGWILPSAAHCSSCGSNHIRVFNNFAQRLGIFC
jgi:hypothetical protein